MVASARKVGRGLLFVPKDCAAKGGYTLGNFGIVCRKNNMDCVEQQMEGS